MRQAAKRTMQTDSARGFVVTRVSNDINPRAGKVPQERRAATSGRCGLLHSPYILY